MLPGIRDRLAGIREPLSGVRPQLNGNRQQPVSPPQIDDQTGVIALRELSGKEPVAQASNFVFVKVAQRVAQTLGRGLRPRTQPVRRQRVEHLSMVCVHGAVHISLYIDCTAGSRVC